jgi:phosphate:Na+ symporter
MLFGVGAGFITQSGRTTSFIMASFVQAGLIQAARALPIVLWANLGCTLVIFSAVFPIHLFALFLLAATGVCIAFERPKPLLNTASATFGLALMLYGLQMMSSGAADLTTFHWFAAVLAFIRTSLGFAFLMGLILTLVAQSHIAVLLISVTMAGRGLFDFDQTLMVICGAHLGAGLITYVTGIHFRGEPRQLVTAQVLYNLTGVALVLALFSADHALFGRDALIARLCHAISAAPGGNAAIVAVLMNALTPLLLTLVLEPFHRLCLRLAPPLREEGLARPEFLRAEVSDSPVATLLLAEREQLRLLERLPIYFKHIRGEAAVGAGPTVQAYRDAFIHVSRCIEQFQNGLMAQRMTSEEMEWLLNQKKRQEILAVLDETCFEIHEVAINLTEKAAHLRDVIVESMDMLLLTAISGMAHSDAAELDALETMTRNRGPAMERMRKRYLSLSDELAPDQRSRVLQITNLFERGAWSLHRFGTLLRASSGFDAQQERRAGEWPAPANDGASQSASPVAEAAVARSH